MAVAKRRPDLRVEGSNDVHVLKNLLKKHGFAEEYDGQSRKHGIVDGPEFIVMHSVETLLSTMSDAVALSDGHTIGFVLDADLTANKTGLQQRWKSICSRLQDLGVQFPNAPPAAGFISDVSKYKTRIGIWLMPDNVRDGKLEDFLQDLIDHEDSLIGLARSSTADARANHDAAFKPSDEPKAVLHCWLAWQETPGLPYGAAVTAEWFRRDAPVATRFVDWFRRLYGLGPNMSAPIADAPPVST